MKTITLKKRWIDHVSATTQEEYPAGWSGEVSNDRAERAHRAGVLADPAPAPTKAAKVRD